MPDAEGTFEITGWDQETYDESGGAALTRAEVRKAFSGGLVAIGEARLLLAQAAEGAAAYVGLERIDGVLGGRDGTFVIVHHATTWEGGEEALAAIIPGSGTGGLSGVSGTLALTRHDDGSHSYRITYALE
ncbi:MAG: DUF3224 domain-containing protein [Thermoleophilia bacterium]